MRHHGPAADFSGLCSAGFVWPASAGRIDREPHGAAGGANHVRSGYIRSRSGGQCVTGRGSSKISSRRASGGRVCWPIQCGGIGSGFCRSGRNGTDSCEFRGGPDRSAAARESPQNSAAQRTLSGTTHTRRRSDRNRGQQSTTSVSPGFTIRHGVSADRRNVCRGVAGSAVGHCPRSGAVRRGSEKDRTAPAFGTGDSVGSEPADD